MPMDDLLTAVPRPFTSYATGVGAGFAADTVERAADRYSEDDDAETAVVSFDLAAGEYVADDPAMLAGYLTGRAAARMDWAEVRAALEP